MTEQVLQAFADQLNTRAKAGSSGISHSSAGQQGSIRVSNYSLSVGAVVGVPNINGAGEVAIKGKDAKGQAQYDLVPAKIEYGLDANRILYFTYDVSGQRQTYSCAENVKLESFENGRPRASFTPHSYEAPDVRPVGSR